MIDIDLIRNSYDQVASNLERRGIKKSAVKKLRDLDQEWRSATTEIEKIRAQQNAISRQLSEASTEQRQELIHSVQTAAKQRKKLEKKLSTLTEQRLTAWQKLPNLLSDDVPVGPDSQSNVVLRTIGEIPSFAFKPLEHWELGEQLGIIDSTTAGTVTGSRFSYLKGKLARLQFALIQFALDTVTDENILKAIARQAKLDITTKPFLPIIPPVMIRPEVMQRMARLEPKDERYYLPSDDLFLVGSAEHTLGPMHMDQILSAQELPLRYVGYSTCFRREAGSYGKDVRGILRVHQFDKIEIESFTSPETSLTEQNFIVAIQEHLMQALKLPYRVVLISSGDTGDPDTRQIDIEVWLPGQNQYRETHSSDLMTDYQARRLGTKVKKSDGTTTFAHMNDATVFAIGRALIAILENNQRADGSIAIPEKLHPYLPFTEICPEKNP